MRRLAMSLCAALFATGLAGQQYSNIEIGPPVQIGSPGNFADHLSFSHWRSGHLLAWDKAKEPVGRIGVYDSQLRLAKMVAVPIEDAALVSIVSVDIAADGNLIASGVATKQDGATARFLAAIPMDGSRLILVRTEPYLSQYICAAGDGSVWTVGEEWRGPGDVKQSGYSVLRRYRFDKGLVRSTVKRELLAGNRVAFGGPVHGAFLECSTDVVHFYSSLTHQLFEYSIGASELKESRVEPFAEKFTEITGMVFTTTGKILASIQNPMATESTRVFELAGRVGASQRNWIPVEGTVCIPEKSCVLELLAMDGDKLILLEATDHGWTIMRASMVYRPPANPN